MIPFLPKFVGAAYLGYLGLRSLIASFRGSKQIAMTTPDLQAQSLSKWVAFRQGLLNNLFNPKAGAIFATALPQFINPGDPAELAQPLWLPGQSSWAKPFGHPCP